MTDTPSEGDPTLGISASQLSDDDLRVQLDHIHRTRHETLLNGSKAALETHTRRMLELEQEFLTRLPTEGGS